MIGCHHIVISSVKKVVLHVKDTGQMRQISNEFYARSQTHPQLNPLPRSVFTLPQTAQLEALYTIIRDKETSRWDFLFYSDRIIRLLVKEGLNHLPVVARTVETPTVSFRS